MREMIQPQGLIYLASTSFFMNKLLITLTSLLLLLLSNVCFSQFVSVNNGFYNQKPSSFPPTKNLVAINEEDSFLSLSVDDIYSIKYLNVGLSYSYMTTGAKIFFQHENAGVVGEGSNGLENHRIGLKLSSKLNFLKRFSLRPYSILSYEVNGMRDSSYGYSYGNISNEPYEIISKHMSYYEPEQFVPTLGIELDVRIFRNLNLVFNYQQSWASSVVSSIDILYTYLGDEQEEISIDITNTGSMMSFGLAWDFNYKHVKKSND